MGVTPDERERLDRAIVSDLRRTAARYPEDPGLARLVAELRTESDRFEREAEALALLGVVGLQEIGGPVTSSPGS